MPSGAHVFLHRAGIISLFASFADLGLVQDDDIDALVVFDADLDGQFDESDHVLFSLTPWPDSPSLENIVGASAVGAAADVFLAAPGQAPRLFASAVNLGLGAMLDDIDGLEIVPCGDPLACATQSSIRRVPGDFDGDADIDQSDWNGFDACFSGSEPYPPGCSPGDFDGDGDIDCTDWDGFTTAWTEPQPPPTSPNCPAAVPAISFLALIALGALLLLVGASLLLRNTAPPASPRRGRVFVQVR